MYTDNGAIKMHNNENDIIEFSEKKEFELRTGFTNLDVENVFEGKYIEKYQKVVEKLESVDRMYLLREMCIRVQKEIENNINECAKVSTKIENVLEMCSCVKSEYFWKGVFNNINSNYAILKILCNMKSQKYIELCNRHLDFAYVEPMVRL